MGLCYCLAIFFKEIEEKDKGGMSKRIEGCESVREFNDRGGKRHERARGAGIASGRRGDRKSTRLNSSHPTTSRMPSSA